MSYTSLASTDFVVSSDAVTAPAWTSGVPTLTAFYTSSNLSTSMESLPEL